MNKVSHGQSASVLPSGARSTGHVHRLTPSDESGAQKDGLNASGRPLRKAVTDAGFPRGQCDCGERPALHGEVVQLKNGVEQGTAAAGIAGSPCVIG